MNKKIYQDKIVYLDDNNSIVAEIDFPKTGVNEITITHTFVDSYLRGQGIAKKLVEEVISIARKEKYNIRATCSYAMRYFHDNIIDIYII